MELKKSLERWALFQPKTKCYSNVIINRFLAVPHLAITLAAVSDVLLAGREGGVGHSIPELILAWEILRPILLIWENHHLRDAYLARLLVYGGAAAAHTGPCPEDFLLHWIFKLKLILILLILCIPSSWTASCGCSPAWTRWASRRNWPPCRHSATGCQVTWCLGSLLGLIGMIGTGFFFILSF